MTNTQFELMTALQYSNRNLKHRLKEFETGDKYVSMKANHKNQLAEKDLEIKKLKAELAAANSATVTVRNYWLQVIEDIDKEHTKGMRAKDARTKELYERWQKSERQIDGLIDERRELKKELYAVKVELEDTKEKNQKLKSQLKKDHENSSVPSSMKPNRKKIPNSREKTGKKPGAQPGHKGHGRKRHEPTNIIDIPPSAEHANNPKYKPTGRIITKQVVNIVVTVTVDEYRTPEYRHRHKGQRVHADFPDGVVNDVNYGGSIKAFLFLLNNHCYVSIDKTKEFLSELTDGQLEISRGMINGLSKEFSNKTAKEQTDAFSRLLCAPVICADFSGSRVNGKQVQVFVCASEDTAMFYARESKGHADVKGTPVENYHGILVHDHDKTFHSYGSLHQECLAHVLRYLIGSIEYERGLTWNKLMWELIREMIHYRNSLDSEDDADTEVVRDFEIRYLQILETAKQEYEFEPPSKYYKDGLNLYKRLLEFKDSHLLFLYDKRVPTSNNLSERLLRKFKRKLKQVMTFRSFESFEYLCTSLGILALMRMQNENLYTSVASKFD